MTYLAPMRKTRGPSSSIVLTEATGKATSASEPSVESFLPVISRTGLPRIFSRRAMSMSMRFSPVRLIRKPTWSLGAPVACKYCIVMAGCTVEHLLAMMKPETAMFAMSRLLSIA